MDDHVAQLLDELIEAAKRIPLGGNAHQRAENERRLQWAREKVERHILLLEREK